MKTLFLLDANSLIHRAFHALPPFTSPRGEPTGALYGLSSILLKILREEKPEYVAALFDRPEPIFREKDYPEYKAQRPPTAEALVAQLISSHELFKKFGIAAFEAAGYEADDLIATLAKEFRGERDLQIVIVTGDMDTLQIVDGEKIVVRSLKKGVSETVTYDEKAVEERYGLKPGQMIDYKALVGDPSDNIKGVPGIGPKTATKFLKDHGTLDNLYSRLEEDPKLKDKLGSWREQAELSKKLVTLRSDVPIHLPTLDGLRVQVNYGELERYFIGLGFETLVKRMREMISLDRTLF